MASVECQVEQSSVETAEWFATVARCQVKERVCIESVELNLESRPVAPEKASY